MSGNGDISSEDMASCFIASTCQLLRKSVFAASDYMHNLLIDSRPVPRSYWILCGSVAEFYIQPLNSCIGDTDVLISQVDEMAFTGDSPVLPSDVSGLADTIKCCKIEPYHQYPGFVRLRILGEISYNWTCKKYELTYVPTSHTGLYSVLNMTTLANSYFKQLPHLFNSSTDIVNGPAIKSQTDPDILGSDNVKSLFCPQWPTEARHWPIRPRRHRWPTPDTISEVVQSGCHVVYVQHRSCKDDKLQWRLSFSFAEVVLLQSWSQTQQIVYHLLRFLAKRELIQKDCSKEDEVLCAYHLKTLMLWTCEEMSPEWWNSSSVIAICCELLEKLLEWFKRKYCPNYFIPEGNLFHQPPNSTVLHKTKRRLNEFINSGVLSRWFVENYILPIIKKYFSSKVERTTKVTAHFMDYFLPLLAFRKALPLESLDLLCSLTFKHSHENCHYVIKYRSSSGLTHGYHAIHIKQLRRRIFGFLPIIENVLCFTHLDNLLLLQHSAYIFTCGEVSLDSGLFVELINTISMQPKIIWSQYHNFPKTFRTHSSRFNFLRAQSVLQNLTGTGSNSLPEFQLVSLVSKEFLKKSLRCDDSQVNGVATVALAYLAALHFTSSEYQEAVRFCSGVFEGHTHQRDKETLNAGCLLFIDDISRIVGLWVLHKKLTEDNLHFINKRLYLDLRLSPTLFACYLAALSAEKLDRNIDFHYDLPDSSFPMDDYLTVLFKPKCMAAESDTHFNAVRQIVYRRRDYLVKTEAGNMTTLMVKEAVLDALLQIALERMISFYGVIRKDFGVHCNTADCYQALYLYKCRKYDEMLHLCERMLHEPDLESDLEKFAFANVLLIPPFDSFFDADIQSLLGFHTLFFYISPLNYDKQKCKDVRPTDPGCEHWFENNRERSVKVELLKLCVSSYSIKRRYFLGRHFLARYLKVRCCIDCNIPYSDSVTDFAAQKTNLPFERMIQTFLLQKIRIIKI